jgi:hypothetical protein
VGSAYSLNANNTIYINGGMSVVIQAGMELEPGCIRELCHHRAVRGCDLRNDGADQQRRRGRFRP